MQDYEKLGLFYLGKTYDMKERQVTPNLVGLRVEASNDARCVRGYDRKWQDRAGHRSPGRGRY